MKARDGLNYMNSKEIAKLHNKIDTEVNMAHYILANALTAEQIARANILLECALKLDAPNGNRYDTHGRLRYTD